MNQVLRTASPAVNAILQAKVLFAEKRGITTKLKITTQLKELIEEYHGQINVKSDDENTFFEGSILI